MQDDEDCSALVDSRRRGRSIERVRAFESSVPVRGSAGIHEMGSGYARSGMTRSPPNPVCFEPSVSGGAKDLQWRAHHDAPVAETPGEPHRIEVLQHLDGEVPPDAGTIAEGRRVETPVGIVL